MSTNQSDESGAVAVGPVPTSPPAPRPRWVQPGEWSWRSYTTGDYAGKTVLMVACTRGGFQFLIELDWDDYGSREEAEELAAYAVRALNNLRTESASEGGKRPEHENRTYRSANIGPQPGEAGSESASEK